MDKNALQKALEAYNANPHDPDAQKAISKHLGTLSVIHRQDDGKVDVQETIDSAQFAQAEGLTEEHGCITARELFAQSMPPTFTDPISLHPLRKGKTTTYPVVDWNHVPELRRFTAAYAAETNQVPTGGSEMAAFQLKQPSLQPPWDRLDNEAQALEKAFKDGKASAAQKALYDRCTSRLSRTRTPNEPALPPPPPPPRPSIGVPDPNAAPAVSNQGLLPKAGHETFILAHPDDQSFVDSLIKQLSPFHGTRRTNLALNPGLDIQAYLKAYISSANVIVVALSANMLASESLMELAEEALNRGKMILPWVVRPCMWEPSIFGNLQVLRGDAFQAAKALSQLIR